MYHMLYVYNIVYVNMCNVVSSIYAHMWQPQLCRIHFSQHALTHTATVSWQLVLRRTNRGVAGPGADAQDLLHVSGEASFVFL